MPMVLNAYERMGDIAHLTNGMTLNNYSSKHPFKSGGSEHLSNRSGFEHLWLRTPI